MDHVRELMTPQPVVVAPDTTLVACAMKMMDLGIRHLPIVEGGEVSGLVDDGAVFGCGALVDGALWFRFDPTGPEKAGDVARGAVQLDVEADLASALKALKGLGAAVVMENGAVVGVISEHDIVSAAAAIIPEERVVDEVVSSPVHTVASETGAQDALATMREHGIRHLVVAEDGVAMGVVSLRDLAAGWRGSDIPVERYMRTQMHTAEGGSSLREAAKRMAEQDIGCLPVLDGDGGATAILTRTDILDAVGAALENEALFGYD